jgi:predicted metal-dependent HD superfamily phosphohydrolase
MELTRWIETRWYSLLEPYNLSLEMKDKALSEILKAYSAKDRHYHNLDHIKQMLQLSEQFKELLNDKETVDFAIFYHDIVYSSTAKDNEEKSAEVAVKKLLEFGLDGVKIEKTKIYILATNSHEAKESDHDLLLFLDFDLMILAAPREQFIIYSKQIRKEYKIFPDLLYNPGRKKVLKHFLEMEHIYKSEYFRKNFEEQARRNLEFEISQL